MSLKITQIPVLHDNYVYLIVDNATGLTGVVDPAVTEPVVAALEERDVGLDFIFNTHHHHDHVGGNLKLKRRYNCQIIGPAADFERIPGIDVRVKDGEKVMFGNSRATVLDTPGHTKGHIAYFFAADAALFCGDTLFSVGCGRLFEGTPAQMWASLQKLRQLPDDTLIYCAHEYTQSNVQFALSLQPALPELVAYGNEVDRLRAGGKPTIPASLKREKACNPFLRADHPDLAAAVGMQDPVEVFAEVRRRKDHF